MINLLSFYKHAPTFKESSEAEIPPGTIKREMLGGYVHILKMLDKHKAIVQGFYQNGKLYLTTNFQHNPWS